MYPNVRAEFARLGLTLEDVSKALGVSIGTVSIKLRKGGFTLDEAKAIKSLIGTDMSIEELFEEAG